MCRGPRKSPTAAVCAITISGHTDIRTLLHYGTELLLSQRLLLNTTRPYSNGVYQVTNFERRNEQRTRSGSVSPFHTD